MRFAIPLSVLLILAWSAEVFGESKDFDPAGSDPKAIEIAERTMDAMGGEEGWASVAYLAFDFVAGNNSYPHEWDRNRGIYKVSWTERTPRRGQPPYPDLVGKKIETIFELATLKGVAFVDGQKVNDPELVEYLIAKKGRGGYGRFVNDTYWLMMPCKLKDPGVHLRYEGEETGPEGQKWDVIKVTFDEDIGMTPKDNWWAYVNQESGLMDRWGMILGGRDRPRSYTLWTGWQKFGPIMLATNRENPGGRPGPRFENIKVSDEVPAGAFDAYDSGGQ